MSIGHRGKTISEKTKEIWREQRKGHWTGDKNPGKVNPPWLGKQLSEEHRASISKANKGKKRSGEALEKIKIQIREITAAALAAGTHNSQRDVECPHCGKIMNIPISKRWHFDKCKLKPQTNECMMDAL